MMLTDAEREIAADAAERWRKGMDGLALGIDGAGRPVFEVSKRIAYG